MSPITPVLLSCVLMFGCVSARSDLSPPVTVDKPQTTPQPAKSDQTPDFLHSGIFDKNPNGLEAWLDFSKDGRYRVANANDLAFSEASKVELQEIFGKESWYDRVKYPAISGNISR